ncbi:hypothetical protein SOHN41_03480 [Shewanella sp. HN-41]|nr:hypothetical protein SOHN41_03480 [Shewanella sp. HN-41]
MSQGVKLSGVGVRSSILIVLAKAPNEMNMLISKTNKRPKLVIVLTQIKKR